MFRAEKLERDDLLEMFSDKLVDAEHHIQVFQQSKDTLEYFMTKTSDIDLLTKTSVGHVPFIEQNLADQNNQFFDIEDSTTELQENFVELNIAVENDTVNVKLQEM